jgi:hypothetical protein
MTRVAQRRLVTYEHFASSRGVARTVYTATMENNIRQWIGGKEIRVRIRAHVLPLVLADARLKNQFETMTSAGAYNPPRRVQTEKALFGIDVRAQPDQRPIYGYLEGSFETSVLQYGPIVLRLRDEARERTTFTLADSLDHTEAGTQPWVAPEPLSAPTCQASHTEWDVVAAPTLPHATGYGFVECQIHGGVALADFAQVVFTRGLTPGADLQERLSDADVEWSVQPEDEP